MVRRLVRRFLHWLKQLLTRLSKTQRHPPSSQTLPPALPPIAAPPQSPSPHRPRPLSPSKPASNRVNNPSNFQMLLGTRQCLPSAAVQDLSQQLAQTDTNATAARKQRLTPENTSQATAVSKPAKENTPNSLATEQSINPTPPAAVFYDNDFADIHQQILESPL
ncbi:MAG: hypothetical protein AAGI45_13900 [Cyanobacteria bacterium P01_H01_bin.26]